MGCLPGSARRPFGTCCGCSRAATSSSANRRLGSSQCCNGISPMRWPIDRNPMTGAAASAPVEAIWLSEAGLRVHCLVAGLSGPAVLLLHGSGFDAAGVTFAAAVGRVAARCRVVAPGLPGLGEPGPMPEGGGFGEGLVVLGPSLSALGVRRVN